MADLSKQTTDFEQSLYDILSGISAVDGGGDISGPRFDLIGLVKVKIDEMMPEGEGVQFSVQDLENTTDTVDLQVNSFLDPAAKFIHQTAPPQYIDGVLCTNAVVNNGDGTGYVEIPADYIRLQSFKMTAWHREVNSDGVITPDHPNYRLQSNTWTRGGIAKPVCVIKRKNVGGTIKRVIEYYSIPSGDHTLEEFIYIPEVAAENIQDNLKDSLTWFCAALVLEAQGYSEPAKNALQYFNETYKNLM